MAKVQYAKKPKIIATAVLEAIIILICMNLGLGELYAQSQPVPNASPVAKKAPKKSKKKKSEKTTVEPEASEGKSGSKLLVSGKSLHLSCTKSLRDLSTNKLECFGNVYIRRPSDLLTSDYAIIDLNTEQLHAEGNVVYFTPDTVVYGAKMDFNFNTETGVIEDGRIESDKYQLVGERIERLAIDHFKAFDGEYTTCRDCPASWKLAGRTIDLTVNGYAKLSHVFVKINEAPSVYIPYAVIPIKTKRQSGLLFPKIQPTSQNGFTLIQPFFWAISRSQDATIGFGFYSLRGLKGELEYRYMFGPRTYGQLNGYYLRDRALHFEDPYFNRWGLNYGHNLSLPFKFEQKLNYLDASDRDYPRKIGDVPGRGEPALVSEAGLTRSTRDLNIGISAKRIHNLLTPSLTGFDPRTVQVLPSVFLTTSDNRVFEGFSFFKDLPLYWGLSANYTRFWRIGPTFDELYDKDFIKPGEGFFQPGFSPLRRAQRFNLVPEIYYSARIADVIELTPSVQYRTYYYLFDSAVAAPTARGYLLGQAEVGTTVEKTFDETLRHRFRPSLTYSNIPVIQQDPYHPFIQQLKIAGNQFDENDIVPISNESQQYFVPLGNSLTYRLSNKLIFKTHPIDNPKTLLYQKVVDFVAGQSWNFIEYRKPEGQRQPLSRFFSYLTLNTLRLSGRGEFYYYPYIYRSTYNLSMSYIFARYTRRLLQFERSLGIRYNANYVTASSSNIGGTFNMSINDYFGVSGGIDYQFPTSQNNVEIPGQILGVNAGVSFQSPSQCYRINLLGSWAIDNKKVAVTWNVPVNLTGEGFSNLQEGGGLMPNQQGQR